MPNLFKRSEADTTTASQIVAQLSSDFNSIAIAIIIGAAFLLREWRSASIPGRFIVAATFVTSTAIASCYAGVRFQYGLAEQILIIPLNLDLLNDRLATQGILLLLSISGLIYMGLLSLAGRSEAEATPLKPKAAPRAKAKKPSPSSPSETKGGA